MQIESNMVKRYRRNHRQIPTIPLRSAILAAAFCAALSGLPQAASADTYRWVDDNGVVNYSERKPKDIDASRVTLVSKPRARSGTRTLTTPEGETTVAIATNSRATAPDVPELPQTAELNEDQEAMLKKLQQAEAERLATVAQIKNDNCERSRRVLSNLQQNARLKVTDKDGTTRVLPEEERQQGIADAQRGIVENCNG